MVIENLSVVGEATGESQPPAAQIDIAWLNAGKTVCLCKSKKGL